MKGPNTCCKSTICLLLPINRPSSMIVVPRSISFYSMRNKPLLWTLKTTNKHTQLKNIKTMKKTILTAAIALITVFGISRSTYAATTGNQEVSTMLTNVSSISEIEVHGNVQLYLTTGNTDQVKVYNDYYAE